MRTQTIRNVSLVLLAAASLFGANPTYQVKVNVPFGFHVGETALPPGHYEVDTILARNLVRVRSADSSRSIVILTNGAGRVTKMTRSKLVFNRYGDQYFLSQVWTPDIDAGRQLPTTKSERREARNMNPEVESIVAAK